MLLCEFGTLTTKVLDSFTTIASLGGNLYGNLYFVLLARSPVPTSFYVLVYLRNFNNRPLFPFIFF